MPDWFVMMMIDGWLVVACLLFIIIFIRAFRPSVRSQMDHNARIPFAIEDDIDG